jgi:hypothetical protein
MGWAECVNALRKAEVEVRPALICRAVVPSLTFEPVFMGQACGFPVEQGPEFRILLNNGMWKTLKE